MHNYKELKIWKEGIELAKAVYKASADFPTDERFGLTSQVRRAVVSIPYNIAEGAGRNSDKEFQQFLSISLGSAFELETQIILAHAFGFMEDEQYQKLDEQMVKVQKMINGFRISIAKRL